jgi:hypothetical protein
MPQKNEGLRIGIRRTVRGLLIILAISPIACTVLLQSRFANDAKTCGDQPPPATAAEAAENRQEARELDFAIRHGSNPMNVRVREIVGHRAFLVIQPSQTYSHTSSNFYDAAAYLERWLKIYHIHHPKEAPDGSTVIYYADGTPYNAYAAKVISCRPVISV